MSRVFQNIDPPPPSPPGECVLPPPLPPTKEGGNVAVVYLGSWHYIGVLALHGVLSS
jgi:hypothetical protein